MWRVLALSSLLGCSGGQGSSVDAGVMRTSKFTPLLCTAGTPGDATCPINHVDLGVTNTSFSFVAQPVSQDLYLTNMQTNAYIEGLYVEWWSSSTMPDGSMLLAAAVCAGQTIDPVTITAQNATVQLSLRYDRIVPTRPSFAPGFSHGGVTVTSP